MTTKQAYTEVSNVISDLLEAKYKLQNTFVFKGFKNNEFPQVFFDTDLECGNENCLYKHINEKYIL